MLLRESSRAGQAASRADGRHSETIRIGPIDVCRLQSLKDERRSPRKICSKRPRCVHLGAWVFAYTSAVVHDLDL